jgi:hypothetical protein
MTTTRLARLQVPSSDLCEEQDVLVNQPIVIDNVTRFSEHGLTLSTLIVEFFRALGPSRQASQAKTIRNASSHRCLCHGVPAPHELAGD